MLSNIWKKPTIQIHGSTILSMGFNLIIKAHDPNSWQYYLINEIQSHNQNPWQIIDQKPNFYWQHQKLNSLWQHQKSNFHWQHQKSSSHWQYQKPKFYWQYQKPSSRWQYRKPNLRWHYFQKPKIINAWQKKKKKKLCYNYFLNINMAKTMAIVL